MTPEQTMTDTDTGLWEVSSADYHADTNSDSHSSLEVFRRSIEEYAAVRVFKTMLPPEPTEAMLFGAALHCRVLESIAFPSKYCKSPKFDKRTKDGKAGFAAFQAANNGKQALDEEACDKIEGMFQGMMRNRQAASALETVGRCEQSVRWVHGPTGLLMKCRFDRILENGLVVDIKTTEDPSPPAFARSIANFGYHRQAALYLQGAFETVGADGPFLFIAVSKSPPHETVCIVLEDDSLTLGHRQNQDTLSELADRKHAAQWHGRWCDKTQIVSLPRWAFTA